MEEKKEVTKLVKLIINWASKNNYTIVTPMNEKGMIKSVVIDFTKAEIEFKEQKK